MTADELEHLVLDSADCSAVQRAMEKLDEPQRAKLSTTAQKLYSQLYKCKANAAASPRLKKAISRRGSSTYKYWNSDENRRAALALFGLCPISVVKKRDVYLGYQDASVLEQIIRDRRPEWLDEWIAHELEQDFTQLTFPTIRAWIRDGVCRKPEVDGYYRMYAWYLMRTKELGETVPPITVQLLADPDLLEDIEGLFRVENIAFNTNSWLSKGSSEEWETWTDALLKLSADGHVERGKLMDLALEGLIRDLKQNQLSGFHTFYKRMSPSADELAGHQQQFIDLLCHPVGHVVKFAIDMLSEVEKKGALDAAPVIREIQSVFAGQSKGNATAALKLLKRIIARDKGAGPASLIAVCEALRHSHAEVQALALDIIEAQRKSIGEAERDAISGAESFVAASNRGRLSALLASMPAASSAEPEAASNDNVETPAAPQPVAAYQPISDDINAQQILFPEDALLPIASMDELIDTIFHAVEVVDSPDDVERIIDGISRFAGDRPFDFDARVAPLLHRLQEGRTANNGMFIGYGGVGLALNDLLMTWLTGKLYRTADRGYSHHALEGGFQPLILHLESITARVARRQPGQLLSMPTHRGGWIDPHVWMERLIDSLDHGGALANSQDFRLSMLRLPPDHRSVALESAAALDPSIGRIVRFTLGGDELPKASDRKDWSAWITAARCRAPRKDWSAEFAALNLYDELPDGLRQARYDWRASYKIEQYRDQRWKAPEFTVSVSCEGGQQDARKDGLVDRLGRTLGGRVSTEWSELPTAALNHRTKRKTHFWGETSIPWVSHWLSYIWPQNPSAAFMKAAVKLTERMDEDSSSWTPSAGHFQALFQKNRPWLEPGHLLLALGLAGKDADAKGLAVDALVEGIEGRRFDPSLFASVMARLSEGEWIKYNRLGDALMQVVAVSGLHAAVVGDALQDWLPQLDLKQRNSFRLLEVLVEAQAAANRPLRRTRGKAALKAFERQRQGCQSSASLAPPNVCAADRDVEFWRLGRD